MKKSILATAIAATSFSAFAGSTFYPLTEPATLANTDEATAPFLLPGGWTQSPVTNVADMNVIFDDAYPATFLNWDMIDFGGEDAEFIYIPHEVGTGAGLTRYNRDTGEAAILLEGNNSGVFEADPSVWDHQNDDFGGIDPAVVTPTGTLVVAEEWSGKGRILELMNPETATSAADADWRWLTSIPAVSHEGVKFDKNGNMYFVDENNSGSLYKFVPGVAGDYSAGQTFVMVVDNFAGDPAANYDLADTRTGGASWVAMTDVDGVPVTLVDPFDYSGDGNNRAGRFAADELNGTPYGRPEDLDIKTLTTGNEAVFMATTSENIVYSIELLSDDRASVREFTNSAVTPDMVGNNPVGSGADDAAYGLDDPDNLAVDTRGNVYIIEDEDPADIWQATDADEEGVAASVSLFASLGPFGSEATGFIQDPRDPLSFMVAVQHPDSGNDALWNITHQVATECSCQEAPARAAYTACVKRVSKALVKDDVISGEHRAELIKIARASNCGK